MTARIGVGHGIVVRQHHEQHGQRDVIVVRRALLGFLRPFGVGRLARDQRGDGLALVGHDDEEDVGGHHRRHQRAGVDQRAAAREQQREHVARQHDIAEADQREQRVVLGERRLAEEIVDDPAERERDDADRRRLPRRERQHRGIDEEEARLAVIDPAQQAEAGNPGPVGLPFVPDQVVGQLGRARAYTCSSHRSRRRAPARRRRKRPASCSAIFRNEASRCMKKNERADPGDRRRHMQPAQQHRAPFEQIWTPRRHSRSPNPSPRTRSHDNERRGRLPTTKSQQYLPIQSENGSHDRPREYPHLSARHRNRVVLGRRTHAAAVALGRQLPHPVARGHARRAAADAHDAQHAADRGGRSVSRTLPGNRRGGRAGRGERRRERGASPRGRAAGHRAARAGAARRRADGRALSRGAAATRRCGCGFPTISSTSSRRASTSRSGWRAWRISSFTLRKIADVERVLCASPAYLERRGAPQTPDDLTAARLPAAALSRLAAVPLDASTSAASRSPRRSRARSTPTTATC